jgi:hypothetical protein
MGCSPTRSALLTVIWGEIVILELTEGYFDVEAFDLDPYVAGARRVCLWFRWRGYRIDDHGSSQAVGLDDYDCGSGPDCGSCGSVWFG